MNTSLPAYVPQEFLHTVRSTVCDMDYDLSGLKDSNWTRFGGSRLGDVDVFRNEGRGVRRGGRTAHHIRNDHVNDFLISMPRQALITLERDDGIIHLDPGSFAFCTTAVPCDFRVEPVDRADDYTMTHVRIAGNALRQRVPHIEECCHRRVQLRAGAGHIMQSLFDLALSDGVLLSEGQASNFSGMLVDAVANAILDAPEFAALNSRAVTPRQRIRAAARSFIERNLADPLLDVALVAEHCNISVRHLHAAFAGSEHSVGALIRESRLHRCRDALHSAALYQRSVTEIALMWGFNDPSSFCRAYKQLFGITPSQERAHPPSLAA